ncbi:2-phospho-L-lactate transferase CofD family protein [Novosphingobium sp.]|uniref:2-phospho-L-lactate transferase CofD family protein n=1 Tax=Novosphingobium sp. TaxID=1874826 RepID=UPI002FE27200
MNGKHILALSGGAGGAELAAGLAEVMAPGDLTIAVNTGDDFEHLGLAVCPDLDSVTYALAWLNDSERGSGIKDDTWQAMTMLRGLGEEAWLNLGDCDLAMHVARSWRLRAGETLSEVTARLARELGVEHDVVPMSDDPVRTQVLTGNGWVDLRRWCMTGQSGSAVSGVRFAGAAGAKPSPGLARALERDDLGAIVVCPSNPFLSVDPILALDGVRTALASRQVPLIAVSPRVDGTSVNASRTQIPGDWGQAVNNAAIARHYSDILDHLVIDNADEADVLDLEALGLKVTATSTLMREADDRERLAREVVALAGI